MNIELLKEGFLIMIIGMGFVYFFIMIMIWVMEIVSKFVKFISKFFPEEIEEDKYASKKKSDTLDRSSAASDVYKRQSHLLLHAL